MITLASDFFISYLFRSASSTFFGLCSLALGLFISPRLALGEFLKLAAEGLNILEDCVPVENPVVFLVCPFVRFAPE